MRHSQSRKSDKRGPRAAGWKLAGVAAAAALVVILILVWRIASKHTQPTGDNDVPGGTVATTAGVDPAVVRAVQQARQGVLDDPQSGAAWGKLGMVLGIHGFTTDARACFSRARALDPHDPRWAYFQGTDLCKPEPEQAVEAFAQAAALEGNDSPQTARLVLAEALLHEDQYESAGEQLNQCLRAHLDSPRVLLDLARVAVADGKMDSALADLRQCESDPHARRSALLLKAQALQRSGATSDAAEAISAAEKLGPDLPWPDPWMDQADALRAGRTIRINQIGALLNAGRSAQAVNEAQALVTDYPDSISSWILLGRARTARAEYALAEEAFVKALRLNSDSVDALFYSATNLLYEKKYTEAADRFRKMISLAPDYAEAHHNLAHCLLGLGDRPAAIEEFRAAIRCRPFLAEAHLDLGRQLAASGQKDAARAEFQRAAELAPDDPRPKQALADLIARP